MAVVEYNPEGFEWKRVYGVEDFLGVAGRKDAPQQPK